jgi:Protein of unknown function (DUF3309)
VGNLWGGDVYEIQNKNALDKGGSMLGTVLIVILILALLGALPRWSHSREWGYVPTGGVGLVLLVVVVLVFIGRL